MLQCNRYPGLDANEIIRLTSAIGHKRKFDSLVEQPSERLFCSDTCQIAYVNNAAIVDIQLADCLSLQPLTQQL